MHFCTLICCLLFSNFFFKFTIIIQSRFRVIHTQTNYVYVIFRKQTINSLHIFQKKHFSKTVTGKQTNFYQGGSIDAHPTTTTTPNFLFGQQICLYFFPDQIHLLSAINRCRRLSFRDFFHLSKISNNSKSQEVGISVSHPPSLPSTCLPSIQFFFY